IQPQGQSFKYLELVYEWYSALRRLGLDVDIVSDKADLSGYKMVAIPTLPILPDGFFEKLAKLTSPVLIGPRSGSKTGSFCIPEDLAPGALRDLVPLTVTRVESLRNDISEVGDGFAITRWLEEVETELEPEFALKGGCGVAFRHNHTRYLAAWPDGALLRKLITRMADEAGVALTPLSKGLRVRRTATHMFAFNYSTRPILFEHTGEVIDPAGVSITALTE
ncbi:MAG: beta-galactosidase trimerization domain-containing protein, partial [Pseudomonadota bacterium]